MRFLPVSMVMSVFVSQAKAEELDLQTLSPATENLIDFTDPSPLVSVLPPPPGSSAV